MKIIIFAGGTGKRFWPASRKKSPKQFLPVIGDKPLIQLKYDYLRLGFEPNDIYLSTGRQYEIEARKLLPEIPAENFIFEPEMRDTGPAIAYATAYVAQQYPSDVLSLQWSDHFIKKPKVFIDALKEAEKICAEENRTVMICEQPRFASPHRGYVKFGKKIRPIESDSRLVLSEFTRFVEKPVLEIAREYLRSGDYAWNLGYFVTKPELIMNKYSEFSPETYSVITRIAQNNFSNKLDADFSKLEKISFDYIFAENLNPEDAYVINTNMGWYDVGEWISLKEALEENSDSNVTSGNTTDLDSEDTLVYNYETDKLVATIGLNGMIVVNTPDVVAVFHKHDTNKIKELLKQIETAGLDSYT